MTLELEYLTKVILRFCKFGIPTTRNDSKLE